VYIPKPDGRKRQPGIAALEDKIVQHAVGKVLTAIYKEDFLGFSYGFRPGRGQYDALDALFVGLTRKKVNWVLDADIKGFFDAISHEWMQWFIEDRIADPHLWVYHRRKTKANGEVIIVRYADDFVIGFQHRDEALKQRLEKFALCLCSESSETDFTLRESRRTPDPALPRACSRFTTAAPLAPWL
jgi:retron-type reverse transcriptase